LPGFLREHAITLLCASGLAYSVWTYGFQYAPAAAPPTEEAPSVNGDETCRQSLQCWGDRHNYAASVRCVRPVEELANYTSEWTDGILEPKLSHFRWSPLGEGVLVYIGDRVRFQNGFGAWQDMVYECTYNPVTGEVVDVAVRPGHL